MKTRTVGKQVIFCPRCKWKVDDSEDLKEISRCPKCNTWAWTIYRFKYFEGKKLLGKEAGLTDNDESNMHGETLTELKKIFDKGMEVIK